MTARALRRRPPVMRREVFGPFRGMRTAAEETSSRPDTVHYALNMTCADPSKGAAYTVRPPAVGTSGLPGGFVKLFHVFESSGGRIPLAISSAREIWTLQGDTTWGRVVSDADFSSASIARDPTVTTYYAVTIAGNLVVSDGVNTPWMWDGTSGSGGLTLLSNCPALYGQPTEYAGKLFGIKADDRHTIVWSEENDPSTGYEASGFNNAWTLSQQSETPLVRLHGRNDALYYWRVRGFGAIAGAVASDFRTTHTHDALSQVIGLAGPGAVADSGDALWWYGANERIYAFTVGSREVTDISPETPSQHAEQLVSQYAHRWWRSGETTSAAPVETARAALIGPNDVNDRQQVWFSLPAYYETTSGGVGTEGNSIALLYDAASRRAIGWYSRMAASAISGIPQRAFQALAPFAASDGRHGVFAISSDGGINAPALWHWQTTNQNPTENGTVVEGVLIGPVAGGDTSIEQVWTQCDVVCRTPAVTTSGSGTLALTMTSPLDPDPEALTAVVADPGPTGSLQPNDVSPFSQRVALGIDVVGRSVRPIFALKWTAPTNFGNRQGFGIERYSLTSRALAEDPDAA